MPGPKNNNNNTNPDNDEREEIVFDEGEHNIDNIEIDNDLNLDNYVEPDNNIIIDNIENGQEAEPVYFGVDKTEFAYNYEYPKNLEIKAPYHILNSNDPEIMRLYALDHKEDKPLAMHFVYRRKGILALNKREETAKIVTEGKISKMEPVEAKVDGDTIMLDVHQEDYQNSLNGCWSVAYSNIMRSRGVNVDQKTIRAYRPGTPDMVTEDEVQKYEDENTSEEIAHVFNKDTGHDIYESGELITKIVPNTGLHTRNFGELKPSLPVVTKVDGVKVATIPTKNGDEARYNGYVKVVNAFKETLREGIVTNKSPVALTNGYHYLTVVGMGKDENGNEGFYYKDSLRHNGIEEPEENSPNKIWFMTYDDYMKDLAERNYDVQDDPTKNSEFGLNFSWAEDYSLNDGQKLALVGMKLNGNNVELDKVPGQSFKSGNLDVIVNTPGKGDYNKDALVAIADNVGLYRDVVIVPKTILPGEPVKKNEMPEMTRKVKEAEDAREEEKKQRFEEEKRRRKEERENNPDREADDFKRRVEAEVARDLREIRTTKKYEEVNRNKHGRGDVTPNELGPSDLGPSDLGPSDKNTETKKNETKKSETKPAIDREVIFKSEEYRDYMLDIMNHLVLDDNMKLFIPDENSDEEKAFDARCDKATWGEALKEAKIHLQTISKCYDIYSNIDKRNSVNLLKLDKTINQSLTGLKASLGEYLKYTTESKRGEKNRIAQKMNTVVNHMISRREAVGGNADQRYEALANATEGLYDFTKRLSREAGDNIFSRNSDEFKNMLKAAREIRDKVRPNLIKKNNNTVNMDYLKSEQFKADLRKVKRLADKYKTEKDKDHKTTRSTKKGQIRYEAALQLSKFCEELEDDAKAAGNPEVNTKQYSLGKWETKTKVKDEIDRIIVKRENRIENCYIRGRYVQPERKQVEIKTRVTVEELEDKKETEKKQPEKQASSKMKELFGKTNTKKNVQAEKNSNPVTKPEQEKNGNPEKKEKQEDIINSKPVMKKNKPKKKAAPELC